MNALDNAGAVAARDSVAATLAACAARLVAELNARHLPARVIDAAELADTDALLCAGVGDNIRPRWGGIRHANGSVTTYWISPNDINTTTLDRVWVADTESTATTLQLRPGPDDTVEIGMLVRYHTTGALREPPMTGLNPLSARHDLGLRAGLVDAATPTLRVPHRALDPAEDLRAPIGASGAILGATPAGLPLLVNLAATKPSARSSVTIASEPALLIQVAMRAAALGYHVLVVSDRPAYWRETISAGLSVVNELPPTLPNDGRNVVIVYDRVHPDGPVPAITVRAVEPGTASVADVHLEQDSPDTAVIRTAEFQYRVYIDVYTERNLIRAARERGQAA